MLLAALNVAPIKTPKFGGRWYYVLILYTLALTVVFGRQLLHMAG
jgi:CDP-diacylglycerol--serine O-phosphatidyltransferase